MGTHTKVCQFCDEEIFSAAILCKNCKSSVMVDIDLSSTEGIDLSLREGIDSSSIEDIDPFFNVDIERTFTEVSSPTLFGSTKSPMKKVAYATSCIMLGSVISVWAFVQFIDPSSFKAALVTSPSITVEPLTTTVKQKVSSNQLGTISSEVNIGAAHQDAVTSVTVSLAQAAVDDDCPASINGTLVSYSLTQVDRSLLARAGGVCSIAQAAYAATHATTRMQFVDDNCDFAEDVINNYGNGDYDSAHARIQQMVLNGEINAADVRPVLFAMVGCASPSAMDKAAINLLEDSSAQIHSIGTFVLDGAMCDGVLWAQHSGSIGQHYQLTGLNDCVSFEPQPDSVFHPINNPNAPPLGNLLRADARYTGALPEQFEYKGGRYAFFLGRAETVTRDRRRQAEVEAKAKAQAEAQAAAEEEARHQRVAAERQRAQAAAEEEARRQRVAAERQRAQAAERARQEAEAQRQAEVAAAAAAAAETEAQRRARAQQQRQLQQLQQRYFNAIRQKIKRNWRRPPGVGGNVECVVSLVQSQSGDILDVDVESCQGGNAALEKSVERAVLSSSPLPNPPRPEIFDRQLRFYFRSN